MLYDKILNMLNKIKNRQSGFLEIIVVVVIALLIMKYMGVTVSGVINWFTTFFRDVLK